ncbi:MAG: hypothetical protein K940chlam8_01101, partial [Chlamydiae bacterium]|nr:hypothetical protein [Chlamydiota bacterium]
TLGDAKKGLEYEEKALKMRQALYLDKDHPDVADSLNSVGVAYHTLGDAKKGLEYCEKALNMAKIIYGEDSEQIKIYQKNVENLRKRENLCVIS